LSEQRKPVEIDFFKWVELACRNDLTSLKMVVCMILLTLASTRVPIIGIPLAMFLCVAFMSAMLTAWQRSCRAPPKYLLEHVTELRTHGEEAND
jgi:hypothetical protein